MKKFTTLFFAAALLGVALIGCSKPAEDTATPAAAPAAGATAGAPATPPATDAPATK